ncbi:MAG: hypothetical protein HOO67_06445 [Candidatus Peribacteraceae bacterium]|nr:hypothetical protein [Candidatus Peribacteraceae bacterium]
MSQLDKISEIVSGKLTLPKEQRIQLAKKHSWYLGSEYLGYDVEPFHMDWHNLAQDHVVIRDMLKAPRGHLKSTSWTISHTVHHVIQDRNWRSLIVSKTKGQAELFLSEIQDHLQNEKLTDDFGVFYDRAQTWRQDAITVLGRTKVMKEPTITAIGVGGSVVSRHVDEIILDDVVDDKNSQTEHQREQMRTWIRKTLLPILEPGRKMMIVGTPWHPQDVYQWLEDRWNRIPPPERLRYRVSKFKSLKDDGTALWPAKYPVKELERMRNYEMGDALFRCQMQCDPSGLVGKMFHFDWLQFHTKAELPRLEDMDIVAAWDPSAKETETGSYFAGVCVGRHRQTGLIYILDRFRGHPTMQEAIALSQMWQQMWKPTQQGFETNQMGMLAPHMKRLGLPIKEVTADRDKRIRALLVQVFFQNRLVSFERGADDLMLQEYLDFPEGEHNDLMDALVWCLILLMRKTGGSSLDKKPDSTPPVTGGGRPETAGLTGKDF